MSTPTLLPLGQTDDAAHRYLASLGTDASRRVARSNIELAARALLGMPATKRPTKIGFRGLHLDLRRVPWSSVSVEDAWRVRDVAVGGQRSRRAAGAVCSAFKSVLRASGALTLAHVDALRVDQQVANGRTVRDVLAQWDDHVPDEQPDDFVHVEL